MLSITTSIVSCKSVGSSMTAKMLPGSLNDSSGLNPWKPIKFIVITVVIHGSYICQAIEFEKVLGD